MTSLPDLADAGRDYNDPRIIALATMAATNRDCRISDRALGFHQTGRKR